MHNLFVLRVLDKNTCIAIVHVYFSQLLKDINQNDKTLQDRSFMYNGLRYACM